MRRFSFVVTVVTMMILGLLAGSWSVTRVAAQEATPAAEEFPPEGVTFEPLALALGIDMPSPGDLTVFRFGLEPGSSFPIEEDDPTTGLLVVESGEFTIRSDAPLTVTRSGMLDAAMATAMAGGAYAPEMEEVAAGQEVTLGAGDSALVRPNASGEIRNDSQEQAVALVALVGPPEEEMTTDGTPAP